jgi:hypothetical protein
MDNELMRYLDSHPTRRQPLAERRIMRQLDSDSAVARRQLEANGDLARAADTERARIVGNRIDLSAAVGVHTMRRAVDLVEATRDLAQGDPDTELVLLAIRNTTIRKMNRWQGDLFGELD